MARNKLKRFLAGVCTAAMLLQTAGENSFAVFAAGNEGEIAVGVSDNETVDDDVSSGDTSENIISENEVDGIPVSENNAVNKDERETSSENGDDVNDEEEEIHGLGISIIGGKVYDAESGLEYGTFDSASGELVLSAEIGYVPSYVFANWDDDKLGELKKVSFEKNAKATQIGHNTRGGEGAFVNCKSLIEVDMTNATNLTKINLGAFENCTSLKTVKLNDGLNFIANSSFKNCAIEEIVFGKELVSIESAAFENCKKLHKITLKSSNTTCSSGVFRGCAIDSFVLDYDGTAVLPKDIFNSATFNEEATIVIDDRIVVITEGAFSN